MSHIGYLRDQAQRRAAARWEARYDGECPECDGRIREGDLVRWSGSDVAHADCPSPTSAPAGVCPRCHMTISVSGECECEPRDLDAELAEGLRGWGA